MQRFLYWQQSSLYLLQPSSGCLTSAYHVCWETCSDLRFPHDSSTFPLTLGSTLFYSPPNTPHPPTTISISNHGKNEDWLCYFLQTGWIYLAEEDKTEKRSAAGGLRALSPTEQRCSLWHLRSSLLRSVSHKAASVSFRTPLCQPQSG